ncbi:MAG: dipicolinate synthase subunit DpsA [Solirubrobacterales bacterium]
MSSALSGVKIAVLGGDDRELIVTARLVSLGATVTVVGFPREKIKHGAFIGKTVEEALRGAEVAVFPMPGTDESGTIRAVYTDEKLQITEKGFRLMRTDSLVIIGSAKPIVKGWTEKLGLTLREIGEIDEVAILNSIPTAEGALQIAMEETDSTIHGSKTVVLGMGRVGLTLVRMLKALGAEVTAASRDNAELARAFEMGCLRLNLERLTEGLNEAEIIFNTIPAPVLTSEVLKSLNPDALIIDLASTPGGTDFSAANHYGIKAILAPGLPGKVAPRMAGGVLAEVIPRMINEHLKRQGQKVELA